MTAEEWAACCDPLRLIEVAGQITASERKFRLLTVCAAHLFWNGIPSGEMRDAVEIAERHADGQASPELWATVQGRFYRYAHSGTEEQRDWVFSTDVSRRRIFGLVFGVTYGEILITRLHTSRIWGEAIADIDEVCPLVRDIFDNPFRPVAFDPRWGTSDVLGLAQAIYDDRAFERLPILADALMDAGCENEDIVAHCRGDGPHVRGCWVVDLVLGNT